MRATSTFSLLLAAAAGASAQAENPDGTFTGKLGDAPVTTDNPKGVVYKAVFPDEAFFKGAYPDGGNLKGWVTAKSSEDGVGVSFKFDISGLPDFGGPFNYHIHARPVPDDGNCTATGAHLDPYERGQQPPCNPEAPETCEVGDLSGKHGAIPEGASSFWSEFADLYPSLNPSDPAFFGNLSVVIHLANSTRLTCANFKLIAGGDDGDGDDDYYNSDDEDDYTPSGSSFYPTPTPSVTVTPSVTTIVTSTVTAEATPTSAPTTEAIPTPTPTIVDAGASGIVAKAGVAGLAAVMGAVFAL